MIYLLILAFAIGGLAGCAKVQDQRAFPDVQQKVETRTGYAIAWDQDDAVKRKVAGLLKDDLTEAVAVQIALLNNPAIQAAYQDLTIAEAMRVRAGLLENPEFVGEFKFLLKEDSEILEFGLLQDFVQAALIPQRRSLAATKLEAVQLDVAGAVMDLAFQVRSAFYRYQARRRILEMLRDVLLAAEVSYEMAGRLHSAGNITALELSGRQALFELAKLDVTAAQIDLMEDREQLNTLMGLWGEAIEWDTKPGLPDAPDNKDLPADPEKRAVENSIDLAIARLNIEAAEKDSKIRGMTSILPKLGLGVSTEKEADGAWSVGPALSFPLPVFNQGGTERAVARAELRRRMNLYLSLAIKVKAATRGAVQRVKGHRQRVLYYKKVIMPLREEMTRQTQLHYNAMQIGVFQLLEAKKREINARRRYIMALRDFWVARAELDQILSGRLIGQRVKPDAFMLLESRADFGGGHE
jgi:cobalt-zinc-cadmium efflux system outer membrane protein